VAAVLRNPGSVSNILTETVPECKKKLFFVNFFAKKSSIFIEHSDPVWYNINDNIELFSLPREIAKRYLTGECKIWGFEVMSQQPITINQLPVTINQ